MEANGGTIDFNSKFVVIINQKYGTLPNASRLNYDFDGWYTEKGEKISIDSIVNLSQEHILYAHWKDIVGFNFSEERQDSRNGNINGYINVKLNKTEFIYTGLEILPSPVVYYYYQEYDVNGKLLKQKKKKLMQNVDYTLEYENNIEVEGEHRIILHGIGDYYGEISKDFTITPRNAKKLTIEAIPDMENTKEPLEQRINDAVIVRDGDLVVSKEDYNVKFSESVDKKGETTITVTIEPKRNYAGIASKAKTSFKLIDIENKTNAIELVLSVNNKKGVKYTGKTLKPKVVVTDSNGKKVSSKNYKLIYFNNINVGTASVYAVGKNDYYGTSNKVDFEILPKEFSKVKIMKLSNVMFRKNVDDIHPIVKDGNMVLKENVDYSVSFDTTEGTSLFGVKKKKITITITNLSSNYAGTNKTTTLTITPRKINNVL